MSCYRSFCVHTHAKGVTGKGVRVGHLDTGIDGTHPAFTNRIASFRRFGYRGIGEWDEAPTDSKSHGTHTAGLILAIAPNVELYSGKVLEEGHLVARILSGLDWLLNSNVQVVNLSFGIFSPTPVFRSLIREMDQRDILVVSSIGNRGAGTFSVPGLYPEALTVGASDLGGKVPAFSGSYHHYDTEECHKPDLIAPGVEVSSVNPGGEPQKKSGTSMAAAGVTGLVALLRSAFPMASNALVKKALKESCLPLLNGQSHRAVGGLLQPATAFEILGNDLANSDKQDITSQTVFDLNPPQKYIDDRLKKQLHQANKDSLCNAVFEFKHLDAITVFKKFLGKNGIETDQSSNVKFLKHAPIAICQLPLTIIQQILKWPSLVIAHACDIDRLI